MSEAAVTETKIVPRPVLINSMLRVKVTAREEMDPESKRESLWGTYTATVKPFNRTEKTAYFEANKAFYGPEGKLSNRAGYEAKQVEILAARISEWDAEFPRAPDGAPVIAPINPGTVAALPDFALEEFMAAVLGAAGQIVGN